MSKTHYELYVKPWRANNPERWRNLKNKNNKLYFARLKIQILDHYGQCICNCCGEENLTRLELDHIKPYDKATDPFKRRRGRHLYALLKKLGYPPGFQVLCKPCNQQKGNNEICGCGEKET